jgi:hypothetical protein
LLQLWSGTIKHEHWLDVIVEQLTDAVEEHNQVSIRDRLSTAITDTLHRLVQPDAHIYK